MTQEHETTPAPPAAPAPLVFLVDDDPSVRKALPRLLSAAGFESETFASAQEFLARAPQAPGGGCLVLDMRMPGMSGLELQEKLIAANINLPIIFISGHGDIPSSVAAMKKGAVDFLTKPFDSKALLNAVRTSIRKSLETQQDQTERDQARALIATLTPRERQVMEKVVAGLMNKEIAAELDISEATVKVHRGRVMEKSKVASVADLVRLRVCALE